MRRMKVAGLLGALLLLVAVNIGVAGVADSEDYTDPESELWDSVTTRRPIPFENMFGYEDFVQVKEVEVDEQLIATHVKTGEDQLVTYVHWQYPLGSGDAPDVAKVDRYWDWVFGCYDLGQCDPLMTERIDSASNQQNCYAYAMKEEGNRGTYEYWIENVGTSVMDDDFEIRGNKNNVSVGDVLYWQNEGGPYHMSRVMGTLGSSVKYPAVIRWKWNMSGIYQATTVPGHRFHQPYNTCLVVLTKLTDQIGVWDPDHCGGDAGVWEPKAEE